MAIRDVRDLIAVLGQRGPGKRTPPIQGNGGASNVGCGGRQPALFALRFRALVGTIMAVEGQDLFKTLH